MKKQIHVPGFLIGTSEDYKNLTGVTVILASEGAAAGVDVRGGAPGTRETDLLNPEKTVEKIHSVVLSGGSAFGLEASCGVMEYLAEKHIGFTVGDACVPIVCSAVLFDLGIGSSHVWPDKKMGYEAAHRASRELQTGCFGAGTGATVGKLYGFDRCMKSGAGYHEIVLESGLAVGAYAAVNACGEIYSGNRVLAGALSEDRTHIVSSHKFMMAGHLRELSGANTTIGCIMTNARLSKAQCRVVCGMAHDGYALAIRPVHTSMDGDTIFTMASGLMDAPQDTVGYLAEIAMKDAILDAAESAASMGGAPCYQEMNQSK